MAENDETKLCSNCKKQISANNFVMHEMHCRRHIGLCEHCKEPFPRNEMEAHFQESHAKIKCPKCSTEVEIMHLEDHEENDCPKKPMTCIYCELEFPKCDLNSHLDYCGSRTEPCPKCGVFIMLKEQQKHEEQNCQKPVVNNNRSDGAPQRPNRNIGVTNNDIGRNPYDLEAMSRMIGSYFRDAEAANNAQSSVVPKRTISSRRPVEEKKIPKVTNKTSNASRKREEAPADRGESEYDRMLAMQLANDLNNTQDLHRMVEAFEKPTSPVDRMYDATLTDTYDSECSLDRISSMLPDREGISSDEPNNTTGVVGGNEGVAMPGESVYAGGDHLDQNGLDMTLPCEFCLEQFPMDVLIQHQAMCDSNRTVTPMPPKSPTGQPRRKTGMYNAQRLTSEFPNLRNRGPPPPTSLLTHTDSSDDDTNPIQRRQVTVTHKVQRPKPAVARNGAKGNASNPLSSISTNSSTISPSQEIRTVLKKYGVESTDRGDYYTRQGSSSRQSNDATSDSWLQPSSKSTEASRKPVQVGSRTRRTLDNLLSDPNDRSSHDLLGHIGAASRKNDVNSTRQNVTVSKTNTRGVPKVRTSARDVQKEFSFKPPSTSGTGAGVNGINRSGHPGFEVRVRPAQAEETSDLVRQRIRANNVFAGPTGKSSSTAGKKKDNR
ncbi:TRAD1-like protein [Mya arenaria]|uniref:TRAD1-like protein n=1 Tax=Mya arenaria TaxID=6604 RepID=A0ABY7DX78_MYAAR|nr:TRAD1-like protein [Mya arenaria]